MSRLPLSTLALALFCLFGTIAPQRSFAQEPPATVAVALKKAETAIAQIVKTPKAQRSFANTVGAVDDLLTRLDNDTSLTIFMQYVHPDAKIREGSRAAEEAVTNWTIDLSKREDLYRVIKAYADGKPVLSGERKRLLEFTLRDYRRAGMMLPKEKRSKLAELQKKISKLGIQFEQNIAEDESRVGLTKDELRGVPEAVMSRLAKTGDICVMTLDTPTYGAVMDHCEVATTRQKAWMAHKRRAGMKNVRVLEEMLGLRAQAAKLLGFKSVTDYEIETRMAKDARTVANFYEDLRPVIRKKAQKDWDEYVAFKRKKTGDQSATLYPWDYAFLSNLLMKEKYAVDSEKVAEYFPMERVVEGLFTITERLYGIEYREVTSQAKSLGLPVWHADVKLYEVFDKASKKLLGRLYTDLFPRDNKYTHAACWGLQSRKLWPGGKLQVPLTALVCNFTKPTSDKPSLLPHDEVETFFHEFGHGLHNLLTNTTYGRFSGAAVARDFVEAPSQMMENWVWNPEVLKLFAKHYRTGDVLPQATLDGMQAARTLGSGLASENQFFLGLMDQAYHTAPDGKVDTTKLYLDTYGKAMLYQPVPNTLLQASFGHLNGYQGAYYGYMWSLVYAQDMFQRFEELGVLSPETGMYYRTKVLGRGGSMDEMEMLRDYLGREPKMDAFLKHLGLKVD